MKLIKRMIIAKQLNTGLFFIPINTKQGYDKFKKQNSIVNQLLNSTKLSKTQLNNFLYSW